MKTSESANNISERYTFFLWYKTIFSETNTPAGQTEWGWGGSADELMVTWWAGLSMQSRWWSSDWQLPGNKAQIHPGSHGNNRSLHSQLHFVKIVEVLLLFCKELSWNRSLSRVHTSVVLACHLRVNRCLDFFWNELACISASQRQSRIPPSSHHRQRPCSQTNPASQRPHHTVERLSSPFSSRLLHPRCMRSCYLTAFPPVAVRLHNCAQPLVSPTNI